MTTLARVAVYVSSVPSAWRTTKVTLLPASPLSQPVMTSAVCPAALFPSTEMMVSPPTKPSFWAGAPSYTPTIERPSPQATALMPMPTTSWSDMLAWKAAYSSGVRYMV